MTEELKQRARESAEQHGYGLGCTVSQTECYEAGYIEGATENGIQWHKDKHLPCGKVEGCYRVFLFDNYREPQIVSPDAVIDFISGQREHIIAWCEIPQFKE